MSLPPGYKLYIISTIVDTAVVPTVMLGYKLYIISTIVDIYANIYQEKWAISFI